MCWGGRTSGVGFHKAACSDFTLCFEQFTADPDIDMYLYAPDPKRPHQPRFVCRRGTNALEGYHRYFNKVLQGHGNGETSAELHQLDRINVWNIDRGITNCGEPNLGLYDR